MARKNIKVPEDLFYALQEDKDDEQSWPHYLESECLNDGGVHGLESLARSVETIEERTGRIERQVEQLGGGR